MPAEFGLTQLHHQLGAFSQHAPRMGRHLLRQKSESLALGLVVGPAEPAAGQFRRDQDIVDPCHRAVRVIRHGHVGLLGRTTSPASRARSPMVAGRWIGHPCFGRVPIQ